MARLYGTLGGMVKTTIYLPEELDLWLESRSASTATSKAELIRRALARMQADEPLEGDRPVFKVYDSGRSLTVDEMDEAIASRIAERAARR